MKLHYIPIIILLLIGCKKDENCQKEYDDLTKSYDQQYGWAMKRIEEQPESRPYEIQHLNETIDALNRKAHNLEDCCCWQNIPHVH